MRIVFLGNNWVAWQVAHWLREQGEQIVGLVIHPPGKRKYVDEIISSTRVRPAEVFDGARLGEPEILEAIKALKADIALSVLFDYILGGEFIRLFPAGVVNLHPAYLPYNRGQYPNVWSIVDRTPAGVTLHYMDEGIDTGDIIAQRQVPIEPVDTGESLYRKLEHACVELFKETWLMIRSGRVPRSPQVACEGTHHRTQDVERIDAIDLRQTYTVGELIDIIRARTFPPYPGAYFVYQGRKVYLRLELLPEE
ncbi:MAG: formyl transferase [Phycisphaerae bacterium]|nr:formyl transferase [Phycisphaerae bacterium]